jgi:signal transduction histidine kinase
MGVTRPFGEQPVSASLNAVRSALPAGTTLDEDAFALRHRALRRLLALHVPALLAFGLARGEDVPVVAAEAAVVALFAWLAVVVRHRRVTASIVAVGLVASSAAVVHLSDGAVEARIHVLVVLAVVGLYQDWMPLAVALTLALAGQFAATAVDPTLVLPAGSRQDQPWLWAGVHAAASLAVAAVQVALWRVADEQHRRGTQLGTDLARAQSQIEARESVSELFVNLARRNQALLDRQIDLIVGMEEREAEPEQLAQLFQLDHLATRIRRNAESLLVLSGEEPPRRWGRPVPLTDVVRAAVAEVEEYRRVDVLVDESLAVAGRAVADVAHLLAELVENGLQFSPPESRVRVTSVVRPDRSCVLTIEDRGIGLADMELSSANDLLARPPEVDLRLSKRLGFHVVSRLAARYSLRVQLQPTPGGGVTATVRVPEELLAPVEAPVPVVPVAAARPVRPPTSPPTVAGRPVGPARGATPTAPLQPVARPAPPPASVRPAAPAPRPSPPPAPAPAPAPTPVPVAAATPPPEPLATVVAGRVVAPTVPAPAPGGLPRRVPQASLSPQLREAVQRPAPTPGAPVDPARRVPRRSPDEVRSVLSSFQSGQRRGRHEAGAAAQPNPDDCEER